MKTLTYVLLAVSVLGFVVVPSHAGPEMDQDLTKQLSAVLSECDKIKPGVTRAELTKIFREDTGGVAWPVSKPMPFLSHQSFIYHNSWLIKVDVDFSPSGSNVAKPTDIITKISKPYLDDSPSV